MDGVVLLAQVNISSKDAERKSNASRGTGTLVLLVNPGMTL